jgi:hypothetical protein
MRIFFKTKVKSITPEALKERWIRQLLLEEHDPRGLIEMGEYINPISLN